MQVANNSLKQEKYLVVWDIFPDDVRFAIFGGRARIKSRLFENGLNSAKRSRIRRQIIVFEVER